MHLSDLRKQNSTLDFRLYSCSEASPESVDGGPERSPEPLDFFWWLNTIGLGVGMHKTGLESCIWADTNINPINLAEVVFSETGFK